MFDIVLGATARRDMAEVQLFVHYLNLKTGRQTDTQTSRKVRREGGKERKKDRKKRKERKEGK